MTATLNKPRTVSFVSLGCAKNLVDSEVMIAKLGAAGWLLVPDADDADAVVINTCAFIDPAKAESTETILEHAQNKRAGQQLIVAGCLSQRFGEELHSLIPEIDGVVGTGAYASIVELLDDARALAGGGTKELILIAQDTSMWGRDRGWRRGGLADLLRQLSRVDGIEWIRLLYLYPATVDSELIEAMAELPKVCPYMDMPLQHVSAPVLRRMLRPSNGARYLEIVEDFRRRVPGITMRSTFIVGFPGETEADVAELEAWIERAELDRVGFFTYSREEGTPGKPTMKVE